MTARESQEGRTYVHLLRDLLISRLPDICRELMSRENRRASCELEPRAKLEEQESNIIKNQDHSKSFQIRETSMLPVSILNGRGGRRGEKSLFVKCTERFLLSSDKLKKEYEKKEEIRFSLFHPGDVEHRP